VVHRALHQGPSRPREDDRGHDPRDAGRGLRRLLLRLPKINLTDRLKEIKVPVLAITGTEDASAPSTKTIHETIPGSEFVPIPSASHIANIEQPEAFNAALTKFYDRILK
jgi:pimeloyl-ACP methyl ester carboxylesterase